MPDEPRLTVNEAIWGTFLSPDLEIRLDCGNCGTHLPKDDWELRTEDAAEIGRAHV